MDRSEGNDDELYPPAPVPAHERQWRHPSEIGERAWATSEPPLTIGRGLTAATGAVGGVLALAVLWTMLPTHAGRSAGVSVRSTVVATTEARSAALAPTTTSQPSTTVTLVPTTVDTQAVITPSTTPEPPPPLPTYAVEQQGSVTIALGAVAVAVSDGSLVITTAGAVDTGDVVDLRLPGGGTEQARVLLVDQRTGLAVLAHDTPAVQAFSVANGVQPGDVLTFYGAAQVTAVVTADGTVDTATLDPAVDSSMPEGTPVVNQRGELVALCSHGAGGPLLVSVAGLDQLRRALASSAASKVWVGLTLGSDPATGLTVDMLDPAGPAADAGMQVGDRIASIDGVAVADIAQLGAALASHAPGDTVTFVVRRSEGPVTVAVVLGSPRSSL